MRLPFPRPVIDTAKTRHYRVLHRILKVAWRVFGPTTMGVKIIARDPDGRILLVKARYLEQWTLPGGGVHKRETPEDAAVRELREETGIRVAPDELRLVGLLSSFREGKSDYVAVFACELGAGVTPSPGGEIEGVAFCRVDELPEPTSERTRRRIDEFLAGTSMHGMW